MRDATSASGASTLRRQQKAFGKPEKPQDPIKTHGIIWIHPLGGFKHDQKMSIFFQRLTQWIPGDPKTWGRHG
jgi:hypothetical protein